MSFQPDPKLIRLYVNWIEQFDIQHARDWGRRFRADQEAAACEAAVWGMLTDCGVEVEPYADLTGRSRRPDFVCRKACQQFYVEATCIHIDAASAKTALPHPPLDGFRTYANLNYLVFTECQKKAAQCGTTAGPCLVAVVTFHTEASVLGVQKEQVSQLLTGEAMLAWKNDLSKGAAIGDPYEVTHLRSAAFVKPSGREVAHARNSLAGILVCGFGVRPPQVLGLLHPQPDYPFNRDLLDRIPFCRLVSGYQTGTLSTEWI